MLCIYQFRGSILFAIYWSSLKNNQFKNKNGQLWQDNANNIIFKQILDGIILQFKLAFQVNMLQLEIRMDLMLY